MWEILFCHILKDPGKNSYSSAAANGDPNSQKCKWSQVPQSLTICRLGKDQGEKWKTGQLEKNWIAAHGLQTAEICLFQQFGSSSPRAVQCVGSYSSHLCHEAIYHGHYGDTCSAIRPWPPFLCYQSGAELNVHLISIIIKCQTNAPRQHFIAKYGMIPYYTGRVATLVSAHAEVVTKIQNSSPFIWM